MPLARVYNDINLYDSRVPYSGYRDIIHRGEVMFVEHPEYVQVGIRQIPNNIFEQWIHNGVITIIEDKTQESEETMSNLPAVVEKDVFAIMDKLDDEIIQAELENRVVGTWVYSFPGQDGKTQTGLSKRGVDEACTEMAKKGHIIEELGVEYSQCPISQEHVLFKAQVRRVLVKSDGSRVPLESVFGTKRQWIKDTRKNGTTVEDKFWYEKGAAKALRNARSRLIPAEIQATIIALAQKSGKVKAIAPSIAPVQKSESATNPLPPPPIPTPTKKSEAPQKQEPSDDVPESWMQDEPTGNQVVFIPDKVSKKSGTRNGKEWTRYGILSGDVWYNTFNLEFGDLAESACEYKLPVRIWYKESKYGRDVEMLEQVTREPGEDDT